jgi:prepilin-type N-terminal cleavage/methylation domain-containing protein
MNRSRSVSTVRAKRGVTLVELLVAMSLLTIGLLAIVGISAGVSRGLGESRRESVAALAAQSRFETLNGTSCGTFSLDTWVTVTNRGVTEKYRITDALNATRLVEDSVSWKTRKATRKQFFKTILTCRPGS